MSKLSEIIFRSATNHKVSSPFGKRAVISTSKGNTASFHNGTDYSTAGLKLPQYAIAEGTVLSCGCDTAYGGALYAWVSYPDLGVKMLHYHLDSYKVRAGQKVDKNTIIGYTGMTGKATGIHLHLGVKYLAGGDYIDPEKWSKDVLEQKNENTGDDDMTRGYFKKGDRNEGVYAYKQLLIALKKAGVIAQSVDNNNVFGAGCVTATKQVQAAAGLTQDGFAGEKTIRACYTLLAKKIK